MAYIYKNIELKDVVVVAPPAVVPVVVQPNCTLAIGTISAPAFEN
ncbi:hypothetical protein [Chitinophaga silvatica]|nr:hypothetical protein [Chitinophaga silvatica]